jgi:hypothetical protein
MVVLVVCVFLNGMRYETPKTFMYLCSSIGVLDSKVFRGILILLPISEARSRIRASSHEKPIFAKALLTKPKNRMDMLKARIKVSISVKISVKGL